MIKNTKSQLNFLKLLRNMRGNSVSSWIALSMIYSSLLEWDEEGRIMIHQEMMSLKFQRIWIMVGCSSSAGVYDISILFILDVWYRVLKEDREYDIMKRIKWTKSEQKKKIKDIMEQSVVFNKFDISFYQLVLILLKL